MAARTSAAPARLDAYADLYLDVLRQQRMCLCGMMAAEFETLPAPMRDALIGFFDENERWLARVLEQGRKEGTLTFTGSPRATARMIVSGLEGAMLVARPFGDLTRFQDSSHRLLAGRSPHQEQLAFRAAREEWPPSELSSPRSGLGYPERARYRHF